MIDSLFVQDALRNVENEQAQDKMRRALLGVYNETYRDIDSLYGVSRDEDFLDDTGAGGVSLHQLNPKSINRAPSSQQLTAQSDAGFAGLEPPVGG